MPVVVLDSSYSKIGYVAPTFYLLVGGTLPRWNYYQTFDQAANVFKGLAQPTAAGSVSFTLNPVPQTAGINLDFYLPSGTSWKLVDYAYMKANGLPNAILRMYTPGGAGPYFTTFNRKYFGLSATKLTEYDPAKIAALDAFYREVALLKYRYNALVGFLNSLAQKQLTPTEQTIYNQGLLTLQNLNNQVSQIKGIEINYTATGAIGLPIILIIAALAILSGVAAWTVTAIATEQEKTRRINDAYNLAQWITAKKQEIAAQVQAGTLSTSAAESIYNTLDAAAAVGNKIATESSKASTGIFGEVGGLLKWGVIGFVAYGAYKLISQNRSNAT